MYLWRKAATSCLYKKHACEVKEKRQNNTVRQGFKMFASAMVPHIL